TRQELVLIVLFLSVRWGLSRETQSLSVWLHGSRQRVARFRFSVVMHPEYFLRQLLPHQHPALMMEVPR
ncbi:hypothetical protein ACXDX7_005014, partial [Escherichia coli]